MREAERLGPESSLGSIAWTRVPDAPTVLLPIGSTEQHGPHLPFGTDTAIATAVAHGVAARLGGPLARSPVVVAPALPYGASGEHQDFPGTVSIGQDALRIVLVECVRSLSTWAQRIVIVNGHGGNVGALCQAVPQLVREGHGAAWVPCVPPGSDAHAGRAETSLMLWLEPRTVDESAAVPGNTAPLESLMPRLRATGIRSVSESGILGDPGGASGDEGRDLLAAVVEDVCRRVAIGTVDERGCLR